MAEEKAGSFHYGGQAVIEGVMMRGKKHFAVACRRADGSIEATAEPIAGTVLGKLKWLNKPLLRGTLMLADSMVLGMKSLMWAANLAMADEEQAIRKKKGEIEPVATEAASSSPKKAADITLNLTMFVSIVIAVLVFITGPAFLTKLVLSKNGTPQIWRGLLEGAIKLTVVFLYIWGISHLKDIRRIFQYHGAEHKVINAFEAGEELTPEKVQRFSTVHVRCGTSFLMVVVFVSILVFTPLPWHSVLQRVMYKLVLLPVVAGIAYEVIRFAGGRKGSRITRFMLGPGLLMQRITTQEPTDEMVEVAIKSFDSVREAEGKSGEAVSS